jgi:hypothetical protein
MSKWHKDSVGNDYQTSDGKPAGGSGTQVSTPDGKGGVISGGIVWPNS